MQFLPNKVKVHLFFSVFSKYPLLFQASLDNFVKRIKENADAHAQLTDWGLHMANSTVIIQSRVLEPETIMFGKGYRYAFFRKFIEIETFDLTRTIFDRE